MTDVQAAPAGQGEFQYGVFRGSAKEYFGIWIVNILLTVVTLGIYSAWAKVRRKRYFYGNTELAGQSFEYHARGLQIFIGRVIAIGVVVVVNIAGLLHPALGLAGSLLFVIALPWLVKRSLRFNARVTSYRNVRFDFVGGTGGAFVAVILGSLLAIFSLGLLAPFASRWLHRYVVNNLRYGDRAFATDPTIGALYRAWAVPALLTLLGMVILALFGFTITNLSSGGPDGTTALALLYIASFGVLIVLALSGTLYRIGVRNVVWSATLFDGRHRLKSDMGRFRYLWIMVSNLAVTLLTFGLMRPWAAVREARYVTTHSAIRFDGDPGEIVSSIAAAGGAASAEYLEMEGFDFGF